MDAFFVELKRAREARNISLVEISNTTLIDVKMLEALEHGNVNVLPQAYIRAFLREYAGIVGLNPKETMKQYESWVQTNAGAASAAKLSPKEIAEARTPEPAIDEKKIFSSLDALSPTVFKIASALALLILTDIVLWNLLEKEHSASVTETPFREVVKEYETKAALIDTSLQPTAPVVAGITSDSLTLTATTTDSVWLQIVIDEKPMVQHFLYPRSKTTWKAKRRFRFPTIGNPRNIKITLNGARILVPTTNKKVARNLVYSRDSLPRPKNGNRTR